MSIEKMKMVDMIGPIDDLEGLSKLVVLSGNVQIVNTVQEINSTNFKLSTSEENISKLLDVCYIKPYVRNIDYANLTKEMKKLKEMCKVKGNYKISTDQLIFKYDELEKDIIELSSKFSNTYDEMMDKKHQKQETEDALERLRFLSGVDFPLDEIEGLSNFDFNLYKISSENILRLKDNYENTPSIILSAFKENNYTIIMTFTPKILKNDADRVFKSLNCELLQLPQNLEGTPDNIREILKGRVKELSDEIEALSSKLSILSQENEKSYCIIEKSMELEMKSAEVRDNAACTNEFFYLSGWIPESMIEPFKHNIAPYEERLIILEKGTEDMDEGVKPPTKLKNNAFVRPFESMVNMYGIPSYDELDPTTFLGITYMILFGMMFGDLGQGLVFVAAGLFMVHKLHRPNLGGVLARLGVSSSIFGVVYGSFFGFEEVLPSIGIKPLIRPMDNINSMLIYAIIFGVGLLFIGYAFGLINKFRKKDIEDGVFGKDGIAGIAFYILVLTFAILKLTGKSTGMPDGLWYAILIILLLITMLKEPLTNIVKGNKKLYKESAGSYYVEAGFGVMETLISMFSNTVSFVRVGAFALNHVGLFMAFTALANMLHGGVGGAVMYVLGNILIIGLEGLIVFIQGLRLEYYELFSKYYEGAGVQFEPVRLSENNRLVIEKKILNKMANNVLVNE